MVNDLTSFNDIASAFLAQCDRNTSKVAYLQARRREGWNSRTFGEVRERVLKLASYLERNGINEGDRVAIISNTRPEWMEADLAVLLCGGVVVSVYQSLTPDDIGYILFDSGAKVVFAENEEQVAKVKALTSKKCQIPASEERAAQEVDVTVNLIVSFEDAEGAVSLSSIVDQEVVPSAWKLRRRKSDDLASLVYTSGTTGPAKGVMQTHGNHLANVRQAFEAEMYRNETTLFLLLPLAHSFAKLMGYIGFLQGAELRFPSIRDTKSSRADPALVLRDLRMSKSQVIPIVPRILEKLKEAVEARSRERSLRGKILSLALNNALARYQIRRKGRVSVLREVLFLLLHPVLSVTRKNLFGEKFLCR